jgi:hypothetical protein
MSALLHTAAARAAYASDDPMRFADGTPIAMGDRVRCERATPPKGSWPRFAGREGSVVRVEGWLCHAGEKVWVGEIGVELDGSAGTLWFQPTELVRLVLPEQRHRVMRAASVPLAPRGGSPHQKPKKRVADQGVSDPS